MRRNILNKLVLLVTLSAVVACKTKKEVARATAGRTVETTAIGTKSRMLKAISNKQLYFNTLQLKAKANFSFNNNGNDASMNIRIKNNEAIWVSITVIAGIEVARALITPDSLKVLNRLEGTYMVKPFSYIHQFANEQVNFQTLQALVVGNTIPSFISDSSEVELLNNQTVLSGILNGLAYKVNYDPNTKVVQTNLIDKEQDRNLTASYSDFYVVSDRAIPHSVAIKSTTDRKNVNLQLKYSQVGVNESLDFPFSIPKRFTVIN